MKISPRWFQVTGILVVLQFILGGLVAGAALDPLSHVVLGFAVLAASIATFIAAVVSIPTSRAVKALSGVLVLLLVLQVPLGFAMLESDSALLSLVHVANAIAIVGAAFAGFLAARRLVVGSPG